MLLQEFKSRIDLLSQKLHGVDNILGHQLALNEMAGMLGVDVPQVMPAIPHYAHVVRSPADMAWRYMLMQLTMCHF